MKYLSFISISMKPETIDVNMPRNVNNWTKSYQKIYILFHFYLVVQSFWPPPYVIDLHDEDTFEISEDSELKSDDIVEDKDEMIPQEELSRFGFNKDSHKFARLHQAVDGIEKQVEHEISYSNKSFNVSEQNFYQEYPEEKNFTSFFHDLKDNLNVEYHNAMSKNKITSAIKEKSQQNANITIKIQRREDNAIVDYNYDEMKRRFEEKIARDESTEVKYTELKEYEGVADSFKNIWKEKDEINCTIAELRNLNGKALLCLLKEPSNNRFSKFFARLGKISLIWIIVYVVIAVPLWCTRGWCCCCFRCKYCLPRKRIDRIKEYYVQNPVGVVHDDYNNRVEYHPTKYEKYYYNNLERELKKLISH